MNAYHINNSLRLEATFDVNGVLTDPTTVTFKIRVPAGTITTYVYGTDAQLKRDGLGVYYVDYLMTHSGEHSFQFIGTGTCVASREQTFLVNASRF